MFNSIYFQLCTTTDNSLKSHMQGQSRTYLYPVLRVRVHAGMGMGPYHTRTHRCGYGSVSYPCIRKTYILLYRALSFFFMLFHAFSCFSVKAREKYNKSNPPYFLECLGIWLKK